jgi:hypothetical protein
LCNYTKAIEACSSQMEANIAAHDRRKCRSEAIGNNIPNNNISKPDKCN